MKKKIIILGATGFIGKNLIEYFEKKKEFAIYGTYYKTKFIKSKNTKFIKCNLLSSIQVSKVLKNKDIVIMAAATTSGAKDIIERPYIHVTDNAIMNSVITRSAFDNHSKHIIFLSCTVMYHSSKNKIKESDLNLNNEIYPNYFGGAWMKIFSEKMSEFYSRLGRNKYTVIRHSNVYGPHDKYDLKKSHVFGATITKVMMSKNGIIDIWGHGKEKRDFLFVEDLCNFIYLAIKKQKTNYEIFNAGYGNLISINNLVKKIAKHVGKKVLLKHDCSKKSLDTNVVLDCKKANLKLGWRVRNTIDNGIKKTLMWYKKNIGIKNNKI